MNFLKNIGAHKEEMKKKFLKTWKKHKQLKEMNKCIKENHAALYRSNNNEAV